MSSQHKRLNNNAQEQSSSSWITVLPIKQFGFSLWKAEFWDAVYLRYELPLNDFQVTAVVQKFTVQHALSYKKGGFVTLRHNKLCDNIAEMLQEDTKAVRIEPILQPLTGQEQSIGGNVSLEACCKVFWSKCPMPWKQNTQKMLWIEWTQEEKRLQLQDFECSKRLISNPCFLDNKQYEKRLCQMILLKLKEELSVVTYRIRCKISYTLLQSSLLCVRGSHRRSRYDCLFKKDKQDSL